MNSNINSNIINHLQWPRKWIHGCPGEPSIQVHQIYNGLYVFRQSKQVHFEGNFMYMIVGTEK